MPNSQIFCNIPWFELNINNDGSYDLCGCQNDKLLGTELGQVYNIKKISIEDYWNSERLQQARLRKLGSVSDPMCRMCRQKDLVGYNSNRHKENSKSVIFAQQFDRSYAQSPHLHHFEYSDANHGLTESRIHSLHINLTDICNFACRMCNPYASSKLQTEYKQLGWIAKDKKFEHWADDPAGWTNFVSFLDSRYNDIKVIHIIGGEVAFDPKFKFFVDYFVSHGLSESVNLSFTINGSQTYKEYFESLSKYKRTEIGISIEGVTAMGNYIRQGGDIEQILKNIQWLNANKPNNMQLVIRTVPSMLSLPTYHKLIEFAWQEQIPIDASLIISPRWQLVPLLPESIRERIVENVSGILDQLPDITGYEFKNQKDPNRIATTMRNECESIINLARLPDLADTEELRLEAARKLDQWDKLKQINLKNYSAELYNLLKGYGYEGA